MFLLLVFIMSLFLAKQSGSPVVPYNMTIYIMNINPNYIHNHIKKEIAKNSTFVIEKKKQQKYYIGVQQHIKYGYYNGLPHLEEHFLKNVLKKYNYEHLLFSFSVVAYAPLVDTNVFIKTVPTNGSATSKKLVLTKFIISNKHFKCNKAEYKRFKELFNDLHNYDIKNSILTFKKACHKSIIQNFAKLINVEPLYTLSRQFTTNINKNCMLN